MRLLLMGFVSTSLVSSSHPKPQSSSSSDSGIGTSMSTFRGSLESVASGFSVSSQASSYSAFGDDESCPRTSGYYFGKDAYSKCKLTFRMSTATWNCPDKFDLPEKFDFLRVNFGKSSEGYYPLEWYEDSENGVVADLNKDTTVDFSGDCNKIMISDNYHFAHLYWRQFLDGRAQREELRAPRVRGHYIGQGDFNGCRLDSIVDGDNKHWCIMECTDQAKIPAAFKKTLLCWVDPPRRSSSSSRTDVSQFNTLLLADQSEDIPREELSTEISTDGLIIIVKDFFPALKEGIFEWDSKDLVSIAPPQLPTPRTYGYYFGDGKYQKCYFQFRNAGKKYATMRCPRNDDRTSIPDAFLNRTFVYGVKEEGGGPLYYEVELFDSKTGTSPIGTKLQMKYDNSKLKLTFVGFDTPFYLIWSPNPGKDGKAVTLPFETGYYALPSQKYQHMYLRYRHGKIELSCTDLQGPCPSIGINGPYATRLLMGWATGDDGKAPEYIEVELSNPVNGQLEVYPKMWVRSDGIGMKIDVGDGEEVLCKWVESMEFSHKTNSRQKLRESVRRAKSTVTSRLHKLAKK